MLDSRIYRIMDSIQMLKKSAETPYQRHLAKHPTGKPKSSFGVQGFYLRFGAVRNRTYRINERKQQIPQKVTGFSGLSKLTENLCYNRVGKSF